MSALRDFFLHPPEPGTDRGRQGDADSSRALAAPGGRAPATAAALCAPGELWSAAGLVAGDLRLRGRAPVAVVCGWTPGGFEPDELAPLPARSAARRAAGELARQGLQTAASGALCLVLLPADRTLAARSAAMVLSNRAAPTVLALGLNAPEFTPLVATLDEQLLVLPAAADPALGELAVAGAAGRAVPAPATALARLRARLGYTQIRVSPPATAPDAAPPAPTRSFAPPTPPVLDPR